MYGYEATLLLMVGKAMDADRLREATREQVLTQESRTRRPRRGK